MTKLRISCVAGIVSITFLLFSWVTTPLLSQSLTLSIPDTSAAANSLVKIPIRTSNVTGLGILSIAITLSFDQTVLDALGANSKGTISEAWSNPLTTDEPGEMQLIMTGLSTLEGEGILTYLFFEVTGEIDDTTTINLGEVKINEGAIISNAVFGKFTALEGEPFPDLWLTIPDSSGDAGTTIDLPINSSDLTGLNIDSLRITMTYNKYVLDALDVLTTGTLTENWTDSIEANLPGKLSFLLMGTPALKDSGKLCILRIQLKGSPGMATSIHFQGLNFYSDTLKIGTTDGSLAIVGGMGKDVVVSIPDISADSSSLITVPIFISDVTNKGVYGISIKITFDENVLSYQNSFNVKNTLLDGWANYVSEIPGRITVGCAGTSGPLSGQGVLIEFDFQVVGLPGMQTAIQFLEMSLNEGAVSVSPNGSIFTVNYVIPVELVSFHALVKNNEVLLTWQTASESDNFGFEIERSTGGDEWNTIGFIPGHGTTTINHNYSFADKNLKVGTYFYRLKQVDMNGQFEYSKSVSGAITPPQKISLGQNYPNPFNPVTRIPLDLPAKTNVKIILYNLLGEQVQIITASEYFAGHHEITFDATGLKAGLYFYKFEADNVVDVKKLIILK